MSRNWDKLRPFNYGFGGGDRILIVIKKPNGRIIIII